MRILLIEDDRLIGDGIKAGLSKMALAWTGLPTEKPVRPRFLLLPMMPWCWI